MLPPRPAAPVALRRRGAALHAGACTLRAARMPRGSPPASLARSVRAGCALMLSLALLCSAPDALRRHCAALTRAPAPCQLPRLPRGYPAASLSPPCGQAAPDAPASPCRTCRPAQALCCPPRRRLHPACCPPASGVPCCLSRTSVRAGCALALWQKMPLHRCGRACYNAGSCALMRCDN